MENPCHIPLNTIILNTLSPPNDGIRRIKIIRNWKLIYLLVKYM